MNHNYMKCSRCGAENKIVNECRCDPNNLPIKLPSYEELQELIRTLRPAYEGAMQWMDRNQALTYRLIQCVETMMDAGEDNSLWAYHREQTRNAIAEILKDDMNDAEGRAAISKATGEEI
jgi:hypothetical protein